MRIPRGLILLLVVLATSACGSIETEQAVRDRVQATAEELRDRGRAFREQIRDRVEKVLSDLERVVPQASPTTDAPTTRGRAQAGTIDAFLTDVIKSVDTYWTTTLKASGLVEPRVAYAFVEPGSVLRTRCGTPADDRAAFYCPADDTIYVGQTLASELYRGVARGFPGEQAGYGRAVGDFGVAYIVAHEYAHNVQNELGFFRITPGTGDRTAKPFELQADCMAGLWGNSVYREGKLKEGDVQEAIDTALAVGDFEVGSEQHHGTPQERRDAWVTGFEAGDPSDCRRYVPTS